MITGINGEPLTPKQAAVDIIDIFALGNLDNVTEDDINSNLGGDMTPGEIAKVQIQIAKFKARILRLLGH